MGEDCGLNKNLELALEAVNIERNHHKRLQVCEVQGPLHSEGGESRRTLYLTKEFGLDFSKVLLQVMTWFMVDLQRRTWPDRKGKWVALFCLCIKNGRKLSLHKKHTSVLIQHSHKPEVPGRHVLSA